MPYLNPLELFIIDSFNPDNATELDTLRNAAMHAIAIAYVRRVEPAVFDEILMRTGRLLRCLERIEIGVGMQAVFKAAGGGAVIQESIDMYSGYAKEHRKVLFAIMEKVAQCPTEADTKH